jgi:hypothetical protein
MTNDRPVFSSERTPHRDKTVTVKQYLTSGHEPQIGLDTKIKCSTDRRSQPDFDFDSVFKGLTFEYHFDVCRKTKGAHIENY